MCIVRFIVKLLVAIGAINWGLIGLFNYNVVMTLLGGDMSMMTMSMATRTVYVLIGIAGLMFIWCWCKKCCKHTCGSGSGSCVCSRGTGGSCHCGPNCPRCDCGRNKREY